MLWTMLTYEMITNAQQGDPYAMQQILNHYAGYINYAASFVHPYNYSGCYGRITVTFYGYNSNGNRGVAAGLGNIQKLKDGDSLGGRAKASEEFEPVDDDEDFLS